MIAEKYSIPCEHLKIVQPGPLVDLARIRLVGIQSGGNDLRARAMLSAKEFDGDLVAFFHTPCSADPGAVLACSVDGVWNNMWPLFFLPSAGGQGLCATEKRQAKLCQTPQEATLWKWEKEEFLPLLRVPPLADDWCDCTSVKLLPGLCGEIKVFDPYKCWITLRSLDMGSATTHFIEWLAGWLGSDKRNLVWTDEDLKWDEMRREND